jgi:hypothetical protein
MAHWPAESCNEEAMFTHSFHDAAACLLSMPIISKNMILEIERIIMTEEKNLSIIQYRPQSSCAICRSS